MRSLRLSGVELGGILRIEPSEITKITAAGIFQKSGKGYVFGENLDRYLTNLGKRRGRPRDESDADKTELEKRKLRAQIDAIELKNVRILTELKQEAFGEAIDFIASQLVHLRESLRGNPKVDKAFAELFERLADADQSTITAGNADEEIDTD